jgi:hypothetical protein
MKRLRLEHRRIAVAVISLVVSVAGVVVLSGQTSTWQSMFPPHARDLHPIADMTLSSVSRVIPLADTRDRESTLSG